MTQVMENKLGAKLRELVGLTMVTLCRAVGRRFAAFILNVG